MGYAICFTPRFVHRQSDRARVDAGSRAGPPQHASGFLIGLDRRPALGSRRCLGRSQGGEHLLILGVAVPLGYAALNRIDEGADLRGVTGFDHLAERAKLVRRRRRSMHDDLAAIHVPGQGPVRPDREAAPVIRLFMPFVQ